VRGDQMTFLNAGQVRQGNEIHDEIIIMAPHGRSSRTASP